MKVTVCELPDGGAEFDAQWSHLTAHVRDAASQLVLLPGMPFCKWFAGLRRFDNAVWSAAVRAHDEWERHLLELAPAFVLGSRPVDFGAERFEHGVVWDTQNGVRSVHAKSRFRSGNGVWETAWYGNTWPEFVPLELEGARIGFLMGAEVADEEEARRYGEERVDVLAAPRGTARIAYAEWLSRARRAAVLAGAHVLASTRSGAFGGQGCIIAPDGHVMGVTRATHPFLSLHIELSQEVMTASLPLSTASAAGAWIDPLETGVPPY